ncbi:hypothetical protein [Streptomyces scabiei]|uniref:hypothetical protein n=1 Tax=Streptomyces scabiei TaxID=1930 RepID=UPI00131D5A84|nr:hypothetical protein [Streptomyces scabiei]
MSRNRSCIERLGAEHGGGLGPAAGRRAPLAGYVVGTAGLAVEALWVVPVR